jgi:CRISPR-associated protein Csh1
VNKVGFLDAVYTIGKTYSKTGSFEYTDYLSLPMDPNKAVKVIRIHLEVEDVNEIPLKIKAVSKVSLSDYMSGDLDETEWKERFLYREPPGSNTMWRYTPIHKIGKPKKNEEENLKTITDSIEKIKTTILNDLESSGYISEGSTEVILNYLKDNTDEILKLFNDTKSSYIIVFGIEWNADFLYPGQVKAFREYFTSKLKDKLETSKGKKGESNIENCSFCSKADSTGNYSNLAEVFKFATFDKPSFIPGTLKKNSLKVFPICSECLRYFLNGVTSIERNFSENRVIPKINIWVIPEMFDNSQNKLDRSLKKLAKKYISEDQHESEERLIEDMTNPEIWEDELSTMLLHILFIEPNNAQRRILHMAEDVPPTHIRNLSKLLNEMLKRFGEVLIKNSKMSLSSFFSLIYRTLQDLSGKADNDKEMMKDYAIGIIAKLLNKESVNIREFKNLTIHRLPGIIYSQDDRGVNFAKDLINRVQFILEFLSKYNLEVVRG